MYYTEGLSAKVSGFTQNGVRVQTVTFTNQIAYLSLVLLLISNRTNGLRLHQFSQTKSTVADKSLKIDANIAH